MTTTLTARSIGGLPMQKAGESNPWLNIGIHGDSGIGKTLLGGSAQEVEGMYPVLDIDLEDGQETLRRTYPNVEVVRVTNKVELQAVYDELYHSKAHGFRSVMVDSTTELDQYTMTEVMAEKLTLDPLAEDTPEWPEHRKKLIRMRAMIRGFRDLPMHTIFTSLTLPVKDQKTGATILLPSHSGQFKLDYPALLDVILYYYAKESVVDDIPVTIRCLLSQKTEKAMAKDRTGTLPPVMQAPTMQKIYDLMWDKTSESKVTTEPKGDPVTFTEANADFQIDI